MKTSIKNIISIEEFLLNYILNEKDSKKYDGGRVTLTHEEMNLYLFVNGYKSPNRIPFKKVKEFDLLTGEVLLVKDEIKKVIAYYNPRRTNITLLEQELNSAENKKNALKKRRNYLKSIGYIETKNGEVIEKDLIDEIEDTIIQKINRNKRLANENIHGMKGRIGL